MALEALACVCALTMEIMGTTEMGKKAEFIFCKVYLPSDTEWKMSPLKNSL